jgi:RimJ/RimL family protein N-acetyltransferase
VETLETERLLLRATQESDLAGFTLIHSSPEVELRAALRHWEQHGFGPWSLFDRESDDFVGVVEVHYAGNGLVGIEPEEVEMGWAIVPARRGEGLATEGAFVAAVDALVRLEPPWLVAYVRPDNTASLRVVAKLGMRREGTGRARNGDSVVVFRLYAGG